MNLLKSLSHLFLISTSVGILSASEDLGENAGYQTGSIVSNSALPWYALEGDGPNGLNCIISGSPFSAGEPSTAELTLFGPGVLTFQWRVDSAANDGWLTCDVWNSVNEAEVGGISGSGAGWQIKQIFIPQGETKVLWTYRKETDTFQPSLDDAGRIANVSFTAMPTASQSFDNWASSQGITGDAMTAPNGLSYYSCWAMGLSPVLPVPAGLLKPVILETETRFRVRFSRSATVLLSPFCSNDLKNWDLRGTRSLLVAGSVTAQTVDIDYFVPNADRKFFRCSHPPTVTPPNMYVYLPPTVFQMSSPLSESGRIPGMENYQHQVTLTRGIFLKRHETTYAEWMDNCLWGRANGYTTLGLKQVDVEGIPTLVEMAAAGGRFLSKAEGGDVTGSGPSLNGEGNQPVTNASWLQTLKWLNAKSERDGLAPCYYIRLKPALGSVIVLYKDQSDEYLSENVLAQSDLICQWDNNGYRLPTEAEWENACRGRTKSALNNGKEIVYAWGTNIPGDTAGNAPLDPNVDPIAWYFGNGGASHPVGQKLPNSFGLYDMHGNVMEWCWDLIADNLITQFQPTPVVDPRGQTTNGIYRPMRGGSWRNTGRYLRSSIRDRQIVTLQGGYQTGFRIARNAN